MYFTCKYSQLSDGAVCSFDIDWEWYSEVTALILQFLVVLYLCIAYYNLEIVCDAFIYYFASPLKINELLQYHC